MAEDINESWLDLEDVEENKVVLLQSHIRGHLTRKWMKALQLEFEEMCRNLECKPVEIEWPRNHLCSPKIINPKQRKMKSNGKEEDSKVSKTTMSENREKISVEIQTENSDYLSEINLKRHNSEFGCNSDSSRQNLRMNEQVVSKKELTSETGLASRTAPNKTLDEFSGSGTIQDPILVGDEPSERDNNSQRNFYPISANSDKYNNNVCEFDSDVIPERDVQKGCHTQNTRRVPGRVSNVTEERPDISSLADTSSVWDADISSVHGHTDKLPSEKKELTELRKNLAMELLWIQQAITSRKNYLKLKEQMV